MKNKIYEKTKGSPKKRHKEIKDWREGFQREGSLWWMRLTSVALVATSLVVGFMALADMAYAVPLCVALWLLTVVLMVVFPAYFSPLLSRERRQLGYTVKTVDLSPPFVISSLALFLNFLGEFTIEGDFLWLLTIAALATASFLFLMHTLCRDFREHFVLALCVLGLSLLFFVGVAGYVNHCATPDSQYEKCTVTDFYEGGGRNVSYRCLIRLPNGTYEILGLRFSEYDKLVKGDVVYVYRGHGLLGVKYYHVKLEQ